MHAGRGGRYGDSVYAIGKRKLGPYFHEQTLPALPPHLLFLWGAV